MTLKFHHDVIRAQFSFCPGPHASSGGPGLLVGLNLAQRFVCCVSMCLYIFGNVSRAAEIFPAYVENCSLFPEYSCECRKFSRQILVDQCTPQFGCGIHESCIPSPPHGLTKCVCKNGYERLDGKCIGKRLPTETPTTKHNEKTVPITGGQDRGGDGSGVSSLSQRSYCYCSRTRVF